MPPPVRVMAIGDMIVVMMVVWWKVMVSKMLVVVVVNRRVEKKHGLTFHLYFSIQTMRVNSQNRRNESLKIKG